MQPMGDPHRHFWLSQQMALARGIDLAAARREGLLTEADHAEAVCRCRSCAMPEACRIWLDKVGRGAVDAAAPPSWCRNGALFSELAAG